MGFFGEKKWFSFKSDEGGKFAVECVSNGIFQKNVFCALIIRFFWQKKLRTLEKLENMMTKVFFSRKKGFHLLKLHL